MPLHSTSLVTEPVSKNIQNVQLTGAWELETAIRHAQNNLGSVLINVVVTLPDNQAFTGQIHMRDLPPEWLNRLSSGLLLPQAG